MPLLVKFSNEAYDNHYPAAPLTARVTARQYD